MQAKAIGVILGNKPTAYESAFVIMDNDRLPEPQNVLWQSFKHKLLWSFRKQKTVNGLAFVIMDREENDQLPEAWILEFKPPSNILPKE
jgi:hypothetical protein